MVSYEAISNRPHLDRLKRFVTALLAQHGPSVAFVGLFGSMARGDFGLGSDYDVIVGLRHEDGAAFLDRLGRFRALAPGGVDVFVYTPAELSQMEGSIHITLLEALEHGIVLVDDGTFAAMRQRHAARKAAGVIERNRAGWRLHPERLGAEAGGA